MAGRWRGERRIRARGEGAERSARPPPAPVEIEGVLGRAFASPEGVVRSREGEFCAWAPEAGQSIFESPVLWGLQKEWAESWRSGEPFALAAIKLPQHPEHGNVDFSIRPDVAGGCVVVTAALSRTAQFMRFLNPGETRQRRIRDEALGLENKRLAHENGSLRDFTAYAAHDMRAPAGRVSLLCKQLKDALGAGAGEEVLSIVEDIELCAHRSNDMVDGLLTLAMCQTGDMARSPVSLSETLALGVAPLAHEIQRTGAIIAFGELGRVNVNQSLCAQVFQNLVGNALKFRAAAPPRIEIVSHGPSFAAPFVQVQIDDNGVGLSEDQAARAFDLFYRARPSVSGCGIGLAVVRTVIDRHGGSIGIEPGPVAGARVTFTLPAA